MSSERVRADAVYRQGEHPRLQRSGRGPAGRDPGRGSRRPVQNQSPFRRLARTHAFIAIGDAAMYGAVAGELLSLGPDAQRSAVLRYLIVSFAPFVVVAPLIGPTIDRIPGGRRMVVQITAVARALLYVMMAFHTDDILLYPLVFVALVMQKTYAVSKSALVPSVVRNHDELVEANSKLGLISGLVGAIAIGPLLGLGHFSASAALMVGVVVFVVATLAARQLPREAIAPKPPEAAERLELRSAGIVLASAAMMSIRGVIGFLTFHLLFWIREDYGLAQFGLAAGASTVGSMAGNVSAPRLRRALREETMLTIALAVIAGAGIAAALTGGLGTAVVVAFVANFSAAISRLAFDSIVQRDAPDANQGRAFARYETRFQLAWVLAGLPPVFFTMPGQVGFVVVGVAGAFATASYLIGSKAMQAGKPLPMSLTQRARQGLAANLAKRRRNVPASGSERPEQPGPASRTKGRSTLPPPRPARRRP
ncbi:MAG: MFS transporter [Ilumatobacteraceae bacterium]